MKPRTRLNLVPLPLPPCINEGTKDFYHHMQEVHKEICHWITSNNEAYKQQADTHRQHVKFQPGDFVLAHIRPERFPQDTLTKLHTRKAGSFKVLWIFDSNTYLLELPPEAPFRPMLNVVDLTAYHGHDPSFHGSTTIADLPKAHKPREDIEAILDNQVVSTRRGGYKTFLNKWKDRPLSDCCWLQIEKVQRLNPNILGLYQSQHPLELDSFGGGKNWQSSITRRVCATNQWKLSY